MILETFLVLTLSVLATKGIYGKVVDNHAVFQKILKDGLYHVTTKERAEQILEDGIIHASNKRLSLGKEKTFFFAGCPSYQELESNCNMIMGRDDMVALKIDLTYDELACHFKERVLNDHAIIYEGSYTLPKDRCSVVCLSIQKNDGKYCVVESEQPLATMERRSELLHTVRLLPHELHLFGAAIKNVLSSKVKLYRRKGTISSGLECVDEEVRRHSK